MMSVNREHILCSNHAVEQVSSPPYGTVFAHSISNQAPTMPSGARNQTYKNMMQCMHHRTSNYESTERSTPHNLSLLNESYATAITMSQAMPSRSYNFSDIAGANQSRHLAT